jgi:hypothetical protein
MSISSWNDCSELRTLSSTVTVASVVGSPFKVHAKPAKLVWNNNNNSTLSQSLSSSSSSSTTTMTTVVASSAMLTQSSISMKVGEQLSYPLVLKDKFGNA